MSMDVFKRVMIEVITSEDVRTLEGIEKILTSIRTDGTSDTAAVRIVVVADEPSLEQIVFGAKDMFAVPQRLEYRRGSSYVCAVEQACEDLGMPPLDETRAPTPTNSNTLPLGHARERYPAANLSLVL
jgi:hypothetical protein